MNRLTTSDAPKVKDRYYQRCGSFQKIAFNPDLLAF